MALPNLGVIEVLLLAFLLDKMLLRLMLMLVSMSVVVWVKLCLVSMCSVFKKTIAVNPTIKRVVSVRKKLLKLLSFFIIL